MDVRQRLAACFGVVFPELEASQVPNATTDSLAVWDSARHFMLMQVIEEEFGIQIPEDVAGSIESFREYEDYLSRLSPV